MNSRQLQYAIMLADACSFSQVADQLDISQPALSKQIIHLEAELGVKLFDRTTTPITLTPAGEFFIDRARALLFEEDQLIKMMERYKSGENGRLIIGISPFRSLYIMPEVIRELKRKFPGLQIVLSEYNSTLLHKGVLDGLYDFAILNLPVDESRLEAIPLEQDMLVLAVHRSMLHLIHGLDHHPEGPVSLADCAALPFATLSQGQEMRALFDRLCAAANIHPIIDVEVVGIATARTLVQAGIVATLLPRQFMQGEELHDVVLLPLQQNAYVRQPAIVYKRGQYISKYAEHAIALLKERF